MINSNRSRHSFVESDEYIHQLVQRCTDKAIAESAGRHRSLQLRRRIISAAAAVIIVAGVALTWGIRHMYDIEEQISQQTDMGEISSKVEKMSPVETYLAQITDEEAQQLVVYDIEDVPEY